MVEQEKTSVQADETEMNDVVMAPSSVITLFVDRASQQWVARDVDGQFWIVPPVDHPWKHRSPFQVTEETQLEPIPGHYKFMLGLPNR